MNLGLIGIAVISTVATILFLGACGLLKLVRWLDWPLDILMLVAMMAIFVVGVCVGAFQLGCIEDKEARNVESTEIRK